MITDADCIRLYIICIEIPVIQHPTETFCLPDNSTLVNQKDTLISKNQYTDSLVFTLSDYSRLKEALIICNGPSTGGMLSKMKTTVSVNREAIVK